MFESYDLNALCRGDVIVYRPFIKLVVGGKTSYQLVEVRRYNTVLYHGQFSYRDILHNKIVLDIKDDKSIGELYDKKEDLYYVDSDDLEVLTKNEKVLKNGFKRIVKLPFNKYIFEK